MENVTKGFIDNKKNVDSKNEKQEKLFIISCKFFILNKLYINVYFIR